MANQTLTLGTPSERINFDSTTLAGLNNGETITINGGHLLFDGDNRWGSNNAVVDSMAVSATLGGSILIDGRNVWEVPFSASTGNVPAIAVAGSNAITGSGITGELLRVWGSALTPEAAGGAMPATGWIKLRSKTGDFSNGLVVTLPGGATITCSGASKRSWINIVAEEAGTVTVPRLGTFTVRGDWYELGSTNGADDQTFQYPIADNCPAIQIETAEGSGIYEWFLNAGSRWGTATQFVPTDVRGKYFGMVNATGVITIAQRATNACGFKPVTGCKVRVPNVMLSNSNSTNYTLNTLHATLATRYDFTTTAAGVVDIEYAACNWYLSLTNTFRVNLKNSSVLQSLLLSNIADTTIFDTVAIGLNSTTEFSPITFTNCFTSIDLTNVRAVRYAYGATGNNTTSLTDCANVTMTDCQFEGFGSTTAITRGNATAHCLIMTRVFTANITRLSALGGRACTITTSADVTLSDLRGADQINGTTVNTNSVTAAIVLDTGAVRCKVDGFSNFGGIANVHPYTTIISATTGCQNIEVTNIGTSGSPYNCGSANATGLGVTSSVTLGLTLRRIYLVNTRTAPLSIANTVQGVVIDNVWGDEADAQAIAAVNCLVRGARWTNSTTGQSSVYGRHWEDAWDTATTGRILISCNEPLFATMSQCSITAGTPAFTSTGQIAMLSVGDQVTWTQPYFTLGVTSMRNVVPVVTGTNAGFTSGTQWTNFDIEFQYDIGVGFNGTWLAFNQATLATISSVNPAIGIKFMLRATVRTASITNALTYIRWSTNTDASSRIIQYPLPQTQLSIVGFESGTDIVIYDATIPADGSGSNVLAVGDAVSGSYTYDYTGTPQIKIGAFKSGFVPQVTPQINLTSSNSSYTIQQRADRNYS